jgi:ELWxxDGT repeat protein
VTNGTTAGTAMYEDLHPGPAGSDPANITPQAFFAGIVAQFPIWYFSANDSTHGREFFVAYDADPPAEVDDIKPRPASSDPGPARAGRPGQDAIGRDLYSDDAARPRS